MAIRRLVLRTLLTEPFNMVVVASWSAMSVSEHRDVENGSLDT